MILAAGNRPKLSMELTTTIENITTITALSAFNVPATVTSFIAKFTIIYHPGKSGNQAVRGIYLVFFSPNFFKLIIGLLCSI